jgi:3-methyl-2-oxobutanoate hydroxymethyltransferase
MPITVDYFARMKNEGQKFAVLTAYDYPTARVIDEAGVPAILIGDSLGMVMLGYRSTIQVTMEDMLHHIKAVRRAVTNAMLIGDLPFMSYHVSVEQALNNAARFVQEGGVESVKLEGGEVVAEKIRRIVDCGIPVMGHIGLIPQSVHRMGGYKAQGKTRDSARQLVQDAIALEQSGVFAIVLETIPAELADLITQKVAVPTIGIGAGPGCDGQVQVINDLLGYNDSKVPRHARQFADLNEIARRAVNEYVSNVQQGLFPTSENSPHVEGEVLEGIG